MSAVNEKDITEELSYIDKELHRIGSQLVKLRQRQVELEERKNFLIDKRDLQKSKLLGEKNWEDREFEWSDQLKQVAKDIFKITTFRPQQLSAMNATLSKNHAIVVMPTGAGKSLCYQLPALISKGITVVVSPLISLMEDQVMALDKINVSAKLLCSTSSRGDTTNTLNEMIDKKSPLKLLYVTPERFAKSKRFMVKLQKCFAEGRLDRIAIDEVHCCSQWGHDFRPDYKYLGILSGMFPDVPILGLTATATSSVLSDIQKMLDIRGSLLIKTSFNRPNLFYHIIDKPPTTEDCVEIIANLITNRFRNESGIIYALSIKDCEDLTTALRSKGIKAGCYHACLEAEVRSAIHTKWGIKYYQVIVATVAFGMGIDKPDVRFVIHHSLSKAMESYYQESGRAGRDGARAECIMMYKMQDIFRLSTMTFSSSGGLDNLYSMVKYCLDPSACRRKIISQYFDEDSGAKDCNKMCDRCLQSEVKSKEISVDGFCRDLYKIIRWAAKQDVKLTARKLLDSWFRKGAANLRTSEVSPPPLSKLNAENVVAFLLIEGYLKEDFHFTTHTTISYLKVGPNSSQIDGSTSSTLKMVFKKFLLIEDDRLAPNSMGVGCLGFVMKDDHIASKSIAVDRSTSKSVETDRSSSKRKEVDVSASKSKKIDHSAPNNKEMLKSDNKCGTSIVAGCKDKSELSRKSKSDSKTPDTFKNKKSRLSLPINKSDTAVIIID